MTESDTVYRVLVGSMNEQDDAAAVLTRSLREQGHEAVYVGDQDEIDVFVTGAVQEDVDIVSITLDHGSAAAARDYLADELGAYGADDILVAVRSETVNADTAFHAWQELDSIGPRNASVLTSADIDPESASYDDIEEALIDGYRTQFDDPEKGQTIGKSQAKVIRSANSDRFDYGTEYRSG